MDSLHWSSHSAYPSIDGGAQSSATTYGQVDDELVHLTYQNGFLAWGSTKLKDEDIIVVTKADGIKGYAIFSLAPEGGEKPFELRTTHASLLPPAFLDRFLFKVRPSYLQTQHVHVLISTLSGTRLAAAFFDEVLHPVLKAIGLADSAYNVIKTSSADSVRDLAVSTLLPMANRGEQQTVLMLSGDGGTVDTINGLMESGERSSTYVRPVLSLFSLGTGNALFHSLHKSSALPSIYIQGVRTLLHGTPQPLPTLYAKFSPGARLLTDEGQCASQLKNHTLYGAVVASYGFHATLVADSDTTEYRKHGARRFALVAKDLLFPENGSKPHSYKAEVALDSREPIDRKEHGYILASLVSNLEKAFTISPASTPLDGKLRVVHFGPFDGEKTMDIMKAAYANGKHVDMADVGYESVDGLRINFKEEGESWKWRRCCIDGLIVGVEEGGWVEIGLVGHGKEAVEVVSDI